MTYSTEIDTVSLQIDCKSIEEQQNITFSISRAIEDYNKVFIKDNIYTKEREIFFKRNKIATIRLGMNPIKNLFTGRIEINYYIVVSFAGLKRYNDILDNFSHKCVLTTCRFLNTFNIGYKFIEFDICLDIFSNIDNVLAVCTTKLPRTEYYFANHSFYNGNTVYIEKINNNRLSFNSQRAYLYNKSNKEKLLYPLTRFEVKLQKLFFLNNEFDADLMVSAFNRYTVMYFEDINEKNTIVNKYNAYTRVSKREIDKLCLNKYKLPLDVIKIWKFINTLRSCRLY